MLTLALLPCQLIAPAIALTFAHSPLVPADFNPFDPGNRTVEVSQDLVEAAHIAEANARPRSSRYCWRYVKRALVASHAVDSYPDGVSAKYAGTVLTENYGFKKLKDITDPDDAPVGAVLVYGGRGYGHVEIRTEDGYVSDFKTTRHSKRPLTGVYVKPSET